MEYFDIVSKLKNFVRVISVFFFLYFIFQILLEVTNTYFYFCTGLNKFYLIYYKSETIDEKFTSEKINYHNSLICFIFMKYIFFS